MEILKRVKDFWQNLRFNWTVINLARDMGKYELIIGYFDIKKLLPVTVPWFYIMVLGIIGYPKSHYAIMILNFRLERVKMDTWRTAFYIPFRKKAVFGRGTYE